MLLFNGLIEHEMHVLHFFYFHFFMNE